MPFANGYTMAMAYNMDGLGKLYISIATAWSAILFMGATFLVSRRDLPYLRIRNIPLALSTVAALHVYWVLTLVAYILQGHFPCAAEFWIMSIYLPLGIALFQACNTQLLHIAALQKRYIRNEGPHHQQADTRDARGWRRYMVVLHGENQVKRTMELIGYCMAVQVTVTLLVFLVSYRFHEGFGLIALKFSTAGGHQFCQNFIEKYHTDSCTEAKKIACRQGWEWIPSIVWQVVWTWCYAPCILWQLRSVQDVHGWRKQTILCCIVGLFATPMWLFALYFPSMVVVNHYYIPPMWFTPSIVLIEASLVFVPCWQVVKNQRLQTETLDIIAEWECKNNGSSVGASSAKTSSKASWKPSISSSTSSRRGEMYTMTAMESAIRTNPQPLLLFAAQKDFSGENISFLMKVLDWKRAWSPSSPIRMGFLRRPSISEINNKQLRRQQFKSALDIYLACVSPQYSEYPINLSHAHLKELGNAFEDAAVIMQGNIDTTIHNAASFQEPWLISGSREHVQPAGRDRSTIYTTKSTHEQENSTDHILRSPDHGRYQTTLVIDMTKSGKEQCLEDVPVPPGFGPDIFDRSEESIKYMVLTNTWPRFVKDRCASNKENKSSIFRDIQEIFTKQNV